jgi:plastocyanin
MPATRLPGAIAFPRIGIARALWLALAVPAMASCSDSSEPAGLSVVAVAATNGQSARIGSALPLPLSVRVQSDGAPAAGVTVDWQASAGTILPASSVTDLTGLASATWTLGTEPGRMTASTHVSGAMGSPVAFSATAVPPAVTATAVASSNNQSTAVGNALPLPLRVQVLSDGEPAAGVIVRWQTDAGSLAAVDSTTDNAGYATAVWTLGTTAGIDTAIVKTRGAQVVEASFSARALPGPAAAIDTAGGAGQNVPSNHSASKPLIALVTDRYGNAIQGQAVRWSVEHGSVAFLETGGLTDAAGRSSSTIAPSGPTGDALVRAALPGAGLAADFPLTIGPPTTQVVLRTTSDFAFVSQQNGSSHPAVDTIPVGRTVEWTLEFDYDLHGVKSTGSPAFAGGDFPYANPSTISVTFPNPGTYHYADPHYPTATGVVVVQ